jgi:predicted RNase H-like HicB family nuclease
VIQLQQNIHAIIRPGEEGGYLAECIEIAVVTQGITLDEISQNLLEAVSLHLEDENPADFGLVARPSLVVSFELQPEYA